jgi:hypothetical protein
VRLAHRPTGISAHGDDSRSQHTNRRLALQRLRMNLACGRRRPLDTTQPRLPTLVAECIFTPRGRGDQVRPKLQVGCKDHRFWSVAAFLLDVLNAFGGGIADSAAYVGISTGNLIAMLKSHRHLFAAAQQIRKANQLRQIR